MIELEKFGRDLLNKSGISAEEREEMEAYLRLMQISNSRRGVSQQKPPSSEVSLDDLNLTTRTKNALKRQGVEKVRIDLSDGDLLSLKNIGRKGLQEIRDGVRQLTGVEYPQREIMKLGELAVKMNEAGGRHMDDSITVSDLIYHRDSTLIYSANEPLSRWQSFAQTLEHKESVMLNTSLGAFIENGFSTVGSLREDIKSAVDLLKRTRNYKEEYAIGEGRIKFAQIAFKPALGELTQDKGK